MFVGTHLDALRHRLQQSASYHEWSCECPVVRIKPCFLYPHAHTLLFSTVLYANTAFPVHVHCITSTKQIDLKLPPSKWIDEYQLSTARSCILDVSCVHCAAIFIRTRTPFELVLLVHLLTRYLSPGLSDPEYCYCNFVFRSRCWQWQYRNATPGNQCFCLKQSSLDNDTIKSRCVWSLIFLRLFFPR